MDGIRIQQLKEAMTSIISDLKPEDTFNIVEFDSTVKVWDVNEVKVKYEDGIDPWNRPYYPDETTTQKQEEPKTLVPAFPATEENLKKAKEVVGKLNAYGGTNIQAALKVGLDLVELSKKKMQHNNRLLCF